MWCFWLLWLKEKKESNATVELTSFCFFQAKYSSGIPWASDWPTVWDQKTMSLFDKDQRSEPPGTRQRQNLFSREPGWFSQKFLRRKPWTATDGWWARAFSPRQLRWPFSLTERLLLMICRNHQVIMSNEPCKQTWYFGDKPGSVPWEELIGSNNINGNYMADWAAIYIYLTVSCAGNRIGCPVDSRLTTTVLLLPQFGFVVVQ